MSEKFLWAPWRADFILGPKEKGCIFCNRIKRKTDREDYILYRGKKVFVILNRYPYNSGHLMVVPNRHVGSLNRMTDDEFQEFFEVTRTAIEVIKEVFHPQSFNIGMNLGRGSGAGVPGHLHMHIVPRWSEDTNFMPVIGKTRVVSFDLGMIYKMLKKGFEGVCPREKSRPKRS
jgi:ATP adenylyltransferase